MRAFAPFILLLLLAACEREPSFDERYEAQTGEIETLARGIENELGQQLNASIAAGRLRTDPNAPPPLNHGGGR